MIAQVKPNWIAVDWGTTNMRAYAVGEFGEVLARASGPGMGVLAASGGDFKTALLAVVGDWLGQSVMPVVACGMVGSRQGWHEAGYINVPQDLRALGNGLSAVPMRDTRLAVWIVPGISQCDPFDVMRGEETQLAGYVARQRDAGNTLDGLVCLPGTHAKWARLDAGALVHFSTAMTGEVFDLLTEHSILAHSVSGDMMDAEAFGDAVQASYHDPARLTQALFSVRAEGLLAGENGARARARVSGLLIGAELAGVRLAAGQTVSLIGAPKLCQAYGDALDALGHTANVFDGEAMVLRGLSAVYAQIASQMGPQDQ